MNFKQKLVYMLIGSLFTLAGYFLATLANNQPTAHAQDNKVIDEIVCKKIRVVNERGKDEIVIGSDIAGGIITINNISGRKRMVIKSSGPSGEIISYEIGGEEDEDKAFWIGSGGVIFYNFLGEIGASMGTGVPGGTGYMQLYNKKGKPLVEMGGMKDRPSDGLINIYDFKGDHRSITAD